MIIGQLVKHVKERDFGIILDIKKKDEYPYLVYFFRDEATDWFTTGVLEGYDDNRICFENESW